MDELRSILKQYWGHDQFRSMQLDIIQSILDGHDTIALLPTGGGKSVCFQLPILASLKNMCLVVSPLIALMNDQIEHLNRQGIPAVMLSSNVDRKAQELIMENCIQGAYRFLYVSPERLTNEVFQQYMVNFPIQYVAIDEAHCISQWGHDFRPAYLKMAELRTILPKVPFVAVTATANDRVLEDIKNFLGLKKAKLFRKSFARENLSITIKHSERKIEDIVHIIKHIDGTGIIYVRNRKLTQEISEALIARGFNTSYYHAGLTIEQRQERQKLWQDDQLKLMVCTNAFGMGIDKANVRFVIHIDVPPSIEEYYQEIGRGGRDGKKSYAVVLINQADLLQSTANMDRFEISSEELQDFYQFLFKFLNVAVYAGSEYCETLDIKELAKKYGTVVSRIHMYMIELDGLGLIEYNIRGSYHHTIQLIKDRVLSDIVKSKTNEDLLIKTLLRRYNSVFVQKTSLDMNYLMKSMNISYRNVMLLLEKLDAMGVADFDKASSDPYLNIVEDRLPSSRSSFFFRHMAQKNKLKRARLSAVHEYLQVKTCKQQSILSYFDEVGAECGLCDYCVSQKTTKKPDIKASLTMFIKQKQNLGYSIDQVLNSLPHNKKELAKDIIRDQNNSI